MATSDDAQLARAALAKKRRNQKPNRQELAALRRIEKQREEELRRQYYASIPQKHWREMSSRQTKQLNEQAQRYGIPFGGKTINLPEVVRKLHDFLAANAHKLASVDNEDELLLGPGNSPWLEKLREETARLKRLDRLERERVLLSRDQVHEGLARLASVLRNLGENLQRHHGSSAADLLEEALEDYEREVKTHFGEDPNTQHDSDSDTNTADH